MLEEYPPINTMLVVLLVVVNLVFLTNNSSATSCRDLEYRIYGNCTENVCGDLIFVDAELGYDTCSRIPSVKDGSLLHKQILEYEVKLANRSDTGAYELKLTRDWYFPEYNLKEMRDYIAFFKIAETPPYSPATSELKKIRDGSIEMLKQRWIEKSVNDKEILYRQLVKDGLLFLLALVPLFISLWFYIGWIRNSSRWSDVKVAVALQACVIGYGFLLVNDYRHEFMSAIIIFLTCLLLFVELIVTMGILLWRRRMSSG